MKHGQMEMVGLVVIVILITLGMLFLAQFALKEKPQKKIFTRKGLAYSTMSAIMKTTVTEPECSDDASSLSIGKDLFDDCAQYYSTKDDPAGSSHYHCGGVHSCTYLTTAIAAFLGQTLGHWNKNYQFTSTLVLSDTPDTQDQPSSFSLLNIESKEHACKGKDQDSSGLFPIRTTGVGLVENVLLICD